MPNWCNNNIVMTGPTDKLQALMASPDEFLGAMVPLGDLNEWTYEKAIDNWGTKWEVDTEGLELTDNGDGTSTIHGYFDSAWSPPIEAFATYGDNNPEIEYILDYLEEGMDNNDIAKINRYLKCRIHLYAKNNATYTVELIEK
jgi:hypothetical protein